VQQPDGLHAMVTAQHLDVVDRYLADLADSVAAVRADPTLAQQGSAATYGALGRLPDQALAQQQLRQLFARQYRRGPKP
jgi:sphinganine-1-phosphate aldolase